MRPRKAGRSRRGPVAPAILVGIGASAGGIEACTALLEAVPENCGAAFIVVLHLDPTRSSQVAEILQSHTRHLAVTQASGTLRLDAGHVYVIAPNSKLQILDGTLEVKSLSRNEGRGQLVDYLFASLAETQGSRAVGIVLSGAGHDGTRGLQKIRAAGGLCIAQDPATASSASMPQSAIDAGVVNVVLPPAAIPDALLEFAGSGTRPAPAGARPEPGDEAGARGDDGEEEVPRGFERILKQLSAAMDVDFDDYKPGTLRRRILRRMSFRDCNDWDEYAGYLEGNPEELDDLYRDVLIGVTEFFRDSEIWEYLAGELPALVSGRGAPGLRAWVPACGTGEEVYSLAMLMFEAVPARDRSRIQIYATDLNERALTVARRAIYSLDALQGVSGKRREQYFRTRDGQLQIERRIRDCVTFAPHNVLTDAPFSKMDVVSCRNLLIYLKPEAHDRVLKRLHFALRPGGLLILGRAEAIGQQARLFEKVSKSLGIYRARDVPRHERFHVMPRLSDRLRGSTPPPALYPPRSLPVREPGPERRIEQYVLRHRTPASVVITTDLEIRHFYGHTEPYLAPPTGESRQDLLSWVRSGLYIGLRSALQQAIRERAPISAEGQIDRGGVRRRVRCTIEPLPAGLSAGDLYLVSFAEVADAALGNLDTASINEPLVRELQQELTDARRDLQHVTEQLEAAGEEHHAGSEELMSLNEELQSSNEELEASKEELEALNEEMITINRELEEKNVELRAANSDLNNLFLSTGVPTVFLDAGLNIRRFTSAATRLMRLVPSDIGRSIEHVKERFDDGMTAQKCRQVLDRLDPDVAEVQTEDGRCYVRNILPYRAEDNQVEGVCITFIDVTDQKRATENSNLAREYAEAIIETVRTPLLVLDLDLTVVSYNRAFATTFHAADRLVGQVLPAVSELQWSSPELVGALESLRTDGTEISDFEVTVGKRTVLVDARRAGSLHGADRLLLSFEDVTEQREAQYHAERRAAELREDARRKDEWLAMLGHELRNPVGAIGNGIELLRTGSIPPERQGQIVQMMQRQTIHITRLLDDLLDAARIISGKLEIVRQPVDLALVGQAAAEVVSGPMRDKQHQLSVTLPPRDAVWVQGDQFRLTEVLSNLLTNSAKYTPRGGHIDLDIKGEADIATITVTDDGMGIDSDLMPRMFEVFTQGKRTLDRGDRGLGLGLSLVRTIVELHGGQVDAASEGSGKGSRFTVRLPRIQHLGVEGHPETQTASRAPKRRILVVDDESDAAHTLAQLLGSQGHEVHAVTHGVAAVEAAQSFRPEVALLDLGLPDLDGYELARRLRERMPGISLIAVTGYHRDPARLGSAGFDHHLLKPVDMEQLSRLLAGSERPES